VNAVGNRLRIASDVDELAAVRRFVRDTAVSAGVGRPEIDDMVQAVDETVTNVIVHGYRGAPGFVDLEIEAEDGALVVRVRDEAPQFDPTTLQAPDTSLPLDQRPFHGMGVFLTRELSDEVSYRYTEGGNELTIVKRYNKPGGGSC
jgi:serine/threonine-protein kinase RsbW